MGLSDGQTWASEATLTIVIGDGTPDVRFQCIVVLAWSRVKSAIPFPASMDERRGGQLRSFSLFLALVSMTDREQLLTISGAAARPSSSHTTKPPPTPVRTLPTPSTPARPPPTLAASPLAAGAVDARSPPHCPHTQSFLRRASPLPSAESPKAPPPRASCLPFLAMLERDLLQPLLPAKPPAFGQLLTLVGNTDLSSLLLPSLRITGISLILIRLRDHSHKPRVLIGNIRVCIGEEYRMELRRRM
ncbi:hypothetical protein MUK42_05069 [Musa troglodytarum]|uniref:Uncharacterized protein n=1 Tax=Musa troglodytarum TaxID=320322 RepID=A0A9E7GUU1_9LILI|nr:hypothetical protein MUK42_05069 [Musa troglodytarum]